LSGMRAHGVEKLPMYVCYQAPTQTGSQPSQHYRLKRMSTMKTGNRQVLVPYGYSTLMMDLDQAMAYMKAVSSAVKVDDQYLSGVVIVYGCEGVSVDIKNIPSHSIIAIDSYENKDTLNEYIQAMKAKDKLEGKQYPDQYEQWKKTYLGEEK
jgi:hypothetical protein